MLGWETENVEALGLLPEDEAESTALPWTPDTDEEAMLEELGVNWPVELNNELAWKFPWALDGEVMLDNVVAD